MDGKLLALAREDKEEIRRRRLAEDAQRHRIAYGRVPELRGIDARLTELVGEVAAFAAGSGRSPDEIRREALALHAHRAELLVESGWPADWLDGAWDCPKCRDTGYAEGRMCSCLAVLYEKRRARELSALLNLGDESFETFDLTLYDDHAAPGGLSPRAQMKEVFGFCRDYADSFGPDSASLLLRGGTGLGKTFLSACIARVVSEQGHSVVYETAVAAMAAFEAQKFRPDTEADARVSRLLGCELLILDDLGTEMITEFSKSALYTLINTRLLDGRKTIVSTNLDPGALERAYTPQIASRLLCAYQDLPFVGTDIRKIRKERGI